MLKHIGLFEGIGGFGLACHWMGWESILMCEWGKWQQKLLQKRFSGVPIHGDIKTLTDEKIKEYIGDTPSNEIILTGGFPCQPFSTAGRREGANDDRYLWQEMLRVIRAIKPAWVVGENVAGILSMAFPSWETTVENGSHKREESEMVAKAIIESLEREGYAVQVFDIPACAVGASHRRHRTWFIAHSSKSGNNRACFETSKTPRRSNGNQVKQSSFGSEVWDDTNTERLGQSRSRRTGKQFSEKQNKKGQTNFPIHEILRLTESPVCGTNDGISGGMEQYRDRKPRLEGLGNAIVPQVAFEIFKAIAKC